MADLNPTGEYCYVPLPVDEIAYRFEKAFRAGQLPVIDDFLEGDGMARWQLLVELIHRELELRLQYGKPARVAEYLERYPALMHSHNDLAALLETEVRFRILANENPSLSDYQEQYSALGAKVREVFKKVGSVPPEVSGYEILDEFGRGGMGVVYRARDQLLRREVALKVIRRDKLGEGSMADRMRTRFRKEAEAMAQVTHLNVVQIYGTGESDGDLFLAMELIEGDNWHARVSHGLPEPREAARILEEVSRGVQAIHDKGLIHRDLKPHNILLGPGNVPKVADFGLARAVETTDGMTKIGIAIGTPEYMSPEQASLGNEPVTKCVDIYGLGAVFYFALTGRPPVSSEESWPKTLEKVRNQPILNIRELRPEVPRDLETICLKCLRKQPRDRYASVAELADDLRRYLEGRPILARPVGSMERAWKWVKRNPRVTGATATVVLALVVGATVCYLKYREAETARRAEAQRVSERDEAIERGDEALRERDKALNQANAAIGKRDEAIHRATNHGNELKYQLGVSNIVLAVTAYHNRDVKMAAECLDHVPTEQRGWEWHYLKQQTCGGIFTLYGHTASVLSVSFSPDGTRIVTGSNDNTTRVWDARTGTPLIDLKEPTAGIASASFSPDGTKIVTGTVGNTARVWDARTGTSLIELKGHTGAVYAASFSADGTRIVTGSNDSTARVWDARTGIPLIELKGHTNAVFAASFSPDSTRIVTGSWDSKARVWDVRTGTPLIDLKEQTGGVNSVSFSPDGMRIITGSNDGTARVWDARTGTPLIELKGHRRRVTSVSFSPDGMRIVTGSNDSTARVWDARTGTPLIELKGHTAGVSSASFSPDGTQIVTGGDEGTAKVWDVRTGASLIELQGHTHLVSSASFSPDGTRIVTGSHDNTARVW
ncbi:MAG TPA: protein kinase, partial [Gemmata sp.]|nr:protein kinase [Gemmata sp.]